MAASRSAGRRGVVAALIFGALFVGFASAGDRSLPPGPRVDAELLLNLDLLGDERFADDRRGKAVEQSVRSLDEFDLPEWDDRGEGHEEPGK